MKIIDQTFETPQENLACDEALLELCEEGALDETLRFWESPHSFVVVGYSNRVEEEAHVQACRDRAVPILRRISGGGTVLQGPGCLNYSLLLRIQNQDFGNTISDANRFIMNRHAAALEKLLGRPVRVQGDTDLAIDGKKFSGNAQRRKNKFLLFHGTFLLNFNLAAIETYLKIPPKQPAYRQGRPHADFVMNLNVEAQAVKQVLAAAWNAKESVENNLSDRIHSLIHASYSSAAWNLKF